MPQGNLIRYVIIAVVIMAGAQLIGRLVRSIFRVIVRRHGGDRAGAPLVRVLMATDAKLFLSALTPEIGNKFDIETELREQLYDALRAAGIEFTHIQRFVTQDSRGS